MCNLTKIGKMGEKQRTLRKPTQIVENTYKIPHKLRIEQRILKATLSVVPLHKNLVLFLTITIITVMFMLASIQHRDISEGLLMVLYWTLNSLCWIYVEIYSIICTCSNTWAFMSYLFCTAYPIWPLKLFIHAYTREVQLRWSWIMMNSSILWL